MEKEIGTMEAQEYILRTEKQKIEADLIVKEDIINLQTAELLKLRNGFAQQANEVKESEEKFKKVLDSLNQKTSDNSENTCCPVCFKDVEIFSIGICDHPICHECSTRMRVLCKEDACPICRQELTKVAFVKEAKPFQLLMLNLYPVDKVTRIHFENLLLRETFEKLLVHVCYTCPTKPTFPNFQMLKDHLRKEHELFFCDLCVENLKIFSQERRAYTRQELALHRRKGDPDNTSHRGHPLCNFCDQRYVDADELFRHLRRDHYFCHFCDADGLNQYYCNYEDLRKHFRDAHFLCEEGECKEEKFTCVFRTEIDIRAHKAQTHSQSLGKAAIKQARTLELEFTLAPRSGESKGRTRRPVQSRASDKQDSENSRVADQQANRVTGAFSPASADIGNPEEFPSLSTGSSSVMNTRNNGSDSLAQKLARGNRFNVKNIVGTQAHDEFPSLVAEGLPSNRQMPLLDDKKTKEKASGIKHTVRLHGQESASNDPVTNGKVTARVSRVSTSANIHVQSSRGLSLENFPSLTVTAPQSSEEPALKPGWIKKSLPKSNNVTSVSSVSKGRNLPPSPEEYPELVPCSSNDASDSSVWTTLKEKGPSSNGISAGVAAKVESSSELSKVKCKKKKNPSKGSQGNEIVQPRPFSCETKKKASEVRLDDIQHLPDEIPKTSRGRKIKLEMTDNIGTFDGINCIGSKVNIIKPQSNSIALENNGARPKMKTNPINLRSSEFPALGMSSVPVTSIFDRNPHDFAQLTRGKKEATAKPTLTNSNAQYFPPSPDVNHAFLQPPDFSARNQQLIATVMDLLCNHRMKIEKFRTISTEFRSGQLDSKEYYMNCLEVMGEDCFLALFPELVCLLPDIVKQQELIKVHRSDTKFKGGVGKTEPYVICATCGQVLSPSDLKHHLANHTLETHFPSLGASPEPDMAWNKR
uniref:RING-type E3 ubiquitin transferase n=1 Tax=Daphnia sinensis TaxID=1820382 RepID=A0A4Y7NCV6_9CRUS|nr:EOG090X01BP [Daphnia sinensis]